MKLNTIKLVSLAAAVSMPFIVGTVHASHELENQPQAPETSNDGHLSWHEFRHELGAYPTVTASMNHRGVITLAGHVDDSTDKLILERLAMKIRGATDIRSTIDSD